MITKPTLTLPPINRKWAIRLGGGVLAVLVLAYAVLSFTFSAESVREQSLNALSNALGNEVTALERQEFSLFPMPKLTLYSIQIKNHPRAEHPSLLKAPSAVVRPSLLSLFSADMVVEIELFRPQMMLESFGGGQHSWQRYVPPPKEGEEAKPVAEIAPKKPAALIQNLQLIQSEIDYRNIPRKIDMTLRNVHLNANFRSQTQFSLDGTFRLAREVFAVRLIRTENEWQAEMHNQISRLSINGNWDDGAQKFSGTQEFTSDDLGQLFEVFLVQGESRPTLPETGRYPLNLKSDFTLSDTRMQLNNIALEGESLTGSGDMLALTGNDTLQTTLDLQLDTFSIDSLLERGVLDEFIDDTSHTATQGGFRIDLPNAKASSLPQNITLTLNAKAQGATLSGITAQKVALVATLKDGAIDVAQLSGKLAGDGQFILKGSVEGSYDGLAFNGIVDVAGQNFAESAAELRRQRNEADDITTETKPFIPEGLKRYRGRAILFVNSGVLRLSEGVMRVEDRQILGTLIRHKRPTTESLRKNDKDAEKEYYFKYEGAFRVINADLDRWRALEYDRQGRDESKQATKEMAFAWMQNLIDKSGKNTFDIKFNFIDYLFDKRRREDSKLRLTLNSNYIRFDELNIPYNGARIQGTMQFRHPPEAKPEIEGALRIDKLNVSEFFETEVQEGSIWRDEEGNWSRTAFDVLWMDDVVTDLKLKIGQLDYGEYRFDDFDAQIKSEKGVVQLSRLETGLWGGILTADGALRVGKLPSIKGNVSTKGFRFAALHSITDLFDNLTGNGSFGLEFTTTGVNPQSAVKNMQGTASFAGSNLILAGVNLNNMIRAANAVRTVDDVDRLINFANSSGQTQIDTVTGSMNIGGGFLRTPGMPITTRMGGGSIMGQVNLLDWKTNVAITLFLSALQKQDPPNIRFVFVGPMKQLERSLDTQSLESFIAKSAAERLLVNP